MAISAMNTSWFNMLHYAHDVYIFSIADAIYFCFITSIQKMINQYFATFKMSFGFKESFKQEFGEKAILNIDVKN